jgi:3-mercaptopropionate dioxygenase
VTSEPQTISGLIRRLDADTSVANTDAICAAVKTTLIESIADGNLRLPEEFTRISSAGYARRLLHCTDRYAIVVMVWGTDQGTPIHDHDGKWCVECVYQGTIQVISYDLVGSPDDELVSFRKEQEVAAGRGEAGSLIPPFDYHVIENQRPEPAITIHVYGGEMHGCDVFQPVEGDRYRRERKPLTYTK